MNKREVIDTLKDLLIEHKESPQEIDLLDIEVQALEKAIQILEVTPLE